MTLIGLLILASGFLLVTLAGTPVAVRRIRGLFFGSYAGVILTVGILVNIGSGFALSTHSLTIPSMRDDLEIWPESGGSRGSGYTWSQQG